MKLETLLRLPSVPIRELKGLPRIPAAYAVVSNAEVLYVGKAKNLASRWIAHDKMVHFLDFTDAKIFWLEGTIDSSARTEVEWYDSFHPRFNKRRPVYTLDFDSIFPEYKSEMNKEVEDWCGKEQALEHRISCKIWDRITAESGDMEDYRKMRSEYNAIIPPNTKAKSGRRNAEILQDIWIMAI